jgi:outer membrane protein assembly factor BamE (lipoprotein component of BamABCDE complex)
LSSARPFLLIAALAAVTSLSGCDTLTEVESWLPGNSAPSFDITQDQPSLEAQFHGLTLKSAKPDDSGTEIALQLGSNADAEEFAAFQRRVPDWVLGTHTDGDTANIVSRTAADLSAEPTSDGFVLKIKPKDAGKQTTAAAEPADDSRDGMQREDLSVVFGVAQTPTAEAPPRGSL